MSGWLAVELPVVAPAGVFLVLFAVALVMPRLAENVRLPGLVGLAVGGMLVGPSGFGVLERDGLVESLGAVGLLFLMFEAGLELDRDALRQERRQTAVFGVLTFSAPFAVGVLVHWWLGYRWLAVLLLASCWSSHTLLAYPIFQRSRVTDNRAVTVGVGGTVITDTAALLFLVAVARWEAGDLGSVYLVTAGPILIGVAIGLLWGIPRLGSWFFASIGQERSARFLFVMVALFSAAFAAELAGVEPIIGAFLAGLALNRIVVRGSALSSQVAFFGSNLLTPVFMISVGMLIDPSLLFSDRTTLVRAAGFTAAVVAGKAIAAVTTGRVFGWRRGEIVALFSLSVAQAAATLAAVFVGFDIGLLDESTVNAVIIVILITCILASLSGSLAASRLPPPPAKIDRIGRRVVMPVSDRAPSMDQLRVAASVAAHDAGTVVPVTVLGYGTSSAELRDRRARLVDTVERMVLAAGAETQSEVRLDSSRTAGILHLSVEQDASCIVIGWKGWSTRRESFFGEAIESLLAQTPVPVLVVRPSSVDRAPTRIVVAYDDNDQRLDHRRTTEIAAVVGHRLAHSLKLPLIVCKATSSSPADLDQLADQVRIADERHFPELVRDITTSGDVLIRGLPSPRSGLGNRFARQLDGLDDLVVVVTSAASAELATPHEVVDQAGRVNP